MPTCGVSDMGAKMRTIECACGCGQKREVREADYQRGWGLYMDKSHKQKHQSESRKNAVAGDMKTLADAANGVLNIQRSVIEKLRITGHENIDTKNPVDPISVYLEDFGKGRGKIIIECYGDCWSNFWPAMGDEETIKSFFIRCDNHYIIKKLSPQLRETVIDYDGFKEWLKKGVINLRKDRDIGKQVAKDLMERIEMEVPDECDEHTVDVCWKLASDIYGDDFHYELPSKPNHHYEYLSKIIDVVKLGIKQYLNSKQPNGGNIHVL